MIANGKPGRIPALDFTKGALVLIMVLYHWLNYFYGPHDSRYLRFLTPSFIFITGFLISNIYISKYGFSGPQLPTRLLARGLKILGVFAFLNLARNVLIWEISMGQVSSAPLSAKYLLDVYFTGIGAVGSQAKAVAFYVLVPIGYLLMLSALLVIISRFYRYIFHLMFLMFLVCVAALDYFGIHTYLELLTIGLLGVIAGYLPIERVNSLVRHPYLLASAYALYLGAITVWNVIYPLQIIGVCLSLSIIYFFGQQNSEFGQMKAWTVLLGKYSLVGYIAQIVILQSLHFVLIYIDSRAIVLGLSFVLAFALTIGFVAILDRTRPKSAVIDKVYKAVFA